MALKDYIVGNVKTGRIAELGSLLCDHYNVERTFEIKADDKLCALCQALCIDGGSFDEIIANSPEVKRTVKGHVFEIVFDALMAKNNVDCIDVGGDTDIDLIVNGISLQLKTPYVNGCSENIVSYKTHKTHGAKSEQESMDYYHKADDFADYLVGLVTYDPFKVVVIPKDELPRVEGHPDYIQSPMYISIENGNYINQFESLYIYKDLCVPADLIKLSDHEILPLTSKEIGVKSEYILEAIYRPENFRIWDMNIRGFIRERSLLNLFKDHGIRVLPTTITA